MAKGEQNKASGQADYLHNQSQVQLQQGIFGGPSGAFGPSGLTSTNQQATNAALTGIGKAQTTGGYDPDVLKSMRQTSSDLVATGGYDPAATNVYKDFALTGGFSPEDKSRYLRQATSGVKGSYDVLQKQAEQQRAATGGIGGDAISQMARQGAQAQAASTDKALADIQSQISTNKLAGAGGLGQVAQQKLGAFNAQSGLEGGVAQGVSGANQMMAFMASDTGKQILSLMGIDSSNQQAAAEVWANLSKNPGMFDDILRTWVALKPKVPGMG